MRENEEGDLWTGQESFLEAWVEEARIFKEEMSLELSRKAVALKILCVFGNSGHSSGLVGLESL